MMVCWAKPEGQNKEWRLKWLGDGLICCIEPSKLLREGEGIEQNPQTKLTIICLRIIFNY